MEKREESLTLVLATSLARKHKYLWAQIKIHVRKSRKEKIRHDITYNKKNLETNMRHLLYDLTLII